MENTYLLTILKFVKLSLQYLFFKYLCVKNKSNIVTNKSYTVIYLIYIKLKSMIFETYMN